MKKAMFALAAMMVAGFAGAVTVNWDKADWTTLVANSHATSWSYATGGSSPSGDVRYSGGADFALYATYSGTIDITKSWSRLLVVASAGGYTGFENNDDKEFFVAVNGSNKPGHTDVALPTGTVEFSLAIVYDYSEQLFSLYYINNGESTLLSTDNEVVISDWVTFKTGDNNGLDKVFETADDALSYTVKYTSDISQLPEPTVLALLALGVAGVALKRKVA